MSDRRSGWYWCKWIPESNWECSQWEGCRWDDNPVSDAPFQIGPRIPSPDEEWQCVPKEPTMKMSQSRGMGAHQELSMWQAWDAMLETAPTPDDTQ